MPKRVQDVTNEAPAIETKPSNDAFVQPLKVVEDVPVVITEGPVHVTVPPTTTVAFDLLPELCRALAVCNSDGEYQRLKGWAETLVKAL